MQNAVSRVLNLTGSGHGVSREQPPFGSILDQLVEFRRISALLAEARRTLLPKGRLNRCPRQRHRGRRKAKQVTVRSLLEVHEGLFV